jgi:hypothetical protein
MANNVKYRVYHKGEQRMYNFVRGYIEEDWLVYDDHGKDQSLWEEKKLFSFDVEAQAFINQYDDTTWEMMQYKEKEYWMMKGYDEENWRGKEIYIGDIVKYVGEGVVEKAYVIQTEHMIFMQDVNECLKEIPYDRTKGKLFVIGNVLENPVLLTNEAFMAERRKFERRQAERGAALDRRTAEKSVVDVTSASIKK